MPTKYDAEIKKSEGKRVLSDKTPEDRRLIGIRDFQTAVEYWEQSKTLPTKTERKEALACYNDIRDELKMFDFSIKRKGDVCILWDDRAYMEVEEVRT